MPMYGADVGQLKTLAQRMELAAQSLDSIAASLHSQVQGARWDGADGVRFSSDWSRRYRPDLREVARRLDDAAKVIRRNAADQERTSSSSGGNRLGRYVNHTGMRVEGLPVIHASWIEGRRDGALSLTPDQIASFIRRASQDGLMIGGAADSLYKWALDSSKLFDKNTLDAVGGWMKVGDGVGFLGTAVGAITGGYRLAEAYDQNDVDGWVRAGLDVTWSVAGIIPVVGAAKASLDVGWFIGDRIYDVGEVIGVNDAVEDAVIGQAVAKGHGADLGNRYDGWGGFWNYSKDYGSALVDGGAYWADKLKFW